VEQEGQFAIVKAVLLFRLIEDFAKPGLFVTDPFPVTVMVGRMLFVLSLISAMRIVGLCSGRHSDAHGRPFNQFI
jgi:hypothetical protein